MGDREHPYGAGQALLSLGYGIILRVKQGKCTRKHAFVLKSPVDAIQGSYYLTVRLPTLYSLCECQPKPPSWYLGS